MLEDTRQTSLCKPVSKTILLGCENGSFPSLFDCHLAISQSSTACYTSFKRGDSGLPADVKIRTIFQLIGIVWSYFLRISRYQCIYICICIQIRIQIVSKYLVSFPSLLPSCYGRQVSNILRRTYLSFGLPPIASNLLTQIITLSKKCWNKFCLKSG